MDPVLDKFFRLIAQPNQTVIWCRSTLRYTRVMKAAVLREMVVNELWGLVEKAQADRLLLSNGTTVIFTTCDLTDRESRGRNNVHIL